MTRHILIVDDERPARTLLEHALAPLEEFDVELHTLEDSAEALATASNHPVALALIDLHMPSMSGTDLCRLLRSHPNAARSHLILMGDKGQELSPAELASCQADGFTSKPFDPVEILDRVCQVLEISRED